MLVYLHRRTAFPDIHGAGDIVGDDRHRPDNVRDQRRPFDRITPPHPSNSRRRLETDEIGLVLPDKLSELARAVTSGQRSPGLLPSGRSTTFTFIPSSNSRSIPRRGRFDTGGITVVQDRDIAREAMYQPDLPLRERRTRGGDHVLDAQPGAWTDHVRVAFHQEAAVLPFTIACLAK